MRLSDPPLREGAWALRWDRVRAIRAALANGGYDLDARLLDLLDDLGLAGDYPVGPD